MEGVGECGGGLRILHCFFMQSACMMLALMPFAAYKTFTNCLRRVRECTATVAASAGADPRHGVAAANFVQNHDFASCPWNIEPPMILVQIHASSINNEEKAHNKKKAWQIY